MSLACTFAAMANFATSTSAQKRVEALPAEHEFLTTLDAAWATGKAEQVLRLFEFVHENLRIHLIGRLDPGMRREERTSTIERVFEIERNDGKTQRACFLTTAIRPVATPHRSQSLFEVLVFAPRSTPSDPPKGMLLIPTTRRAQEHVRPIDGSDDKLRGLPIGNALRGGCPACNWSVQLPATGNWGILLRDATFSGCAEHVEVYDLDHDLMIGLRVEPDALPGLRVDLDKYLEKTRQMLAKMSGVRVDPARVRASMLGGRPARETSFEARDRTWRILGLRSGPMTYLVNVHGPTALLAREKERVDTAIGTFHLLKQGSELDLDHILRVHAPGKLGNDGIYRSRKFGVTIKPPFVATPKNSKESGDEGWTFVQPMGSFALEAYWAHKKFGRFVVFVLDSAQDEIDEGQAQRYLASWLARETNCGTLSKLDPDKIVRRRIAGQRAGWVDFGCASRGCSQSARAFAAAIPHGRRLVLVHGCAEASDEQTAVYDKMVAATLAIELEDLEK
ncbi:MAG: hypothetical protein KDC95_11240 [Planctomycetes bacterium]|nr:hypothetical protein [Planctomycetota bacterium]